MKIIKTILLIFILLLPVIIFGNKDYVELNDLAIMRGIGVSCGKDTELFFQEIIPTKGDGGISYQYDYYQGDGDNLKDAYHKVKIKTKKKVYLSKIKFLVTNCSKSNFILKEFNLKNVKIYHVNQDVLEKLKETKL